MNTFNLWLGMSQAFQDELVALLAEDSTPAVTFTYLNDLDPATIQLFRNIHDAGALEKLFKVYPAGGKDYRIWSLYFAKPENGLVIRDDIDDLAFFYPTEFLPMGAWSSKTGLEVGTSADEEGVVTGAAWFPVPTQILHFMPDVWNGDDPPTFSAATVPTDVNVLAGQTPRSFASYGA